MANSEIYVAFGGDTAGLEASLASANASVRAFARELSALSTEQQKLGQGADAEIKQKMLEVAGELSEAKKAAAEFRGELHKGGEEAEGGIFGKIREGAEGALQSIRAIEMGMSEFIELAAAAFAVERIGEWINETVEAAEKFETLSHKLGVSAEQVQALKGVAKLAGTDFGELETQVERLQLSLAKAGASATPAAAALKVLGINASEFRALSIPAQINEMAEAFSRFADGPAKTAAAIALLGKSGADLISFLDKGKEGIGELNAAVERTGVIMSGETIEAFAKTKEDIGELSLAWTGLSQRIYSVLNPAIDAATRAITNLIEHLTTSDIRSGLSAIQGYAIDFAADIMRFCAEVEGAWRSMLAVLGTSVSTAENTIINSVKSAANHQAENVVEHLVKGAAAWGIITNEGANRAVATMRDGLKVDDAHSGNDALDRQLAHIQLGVAMHVDEIDKQAQRYKRTVAGLLGRNNARHGEGEGEDVAGAEGGKSKPQVPMMDLSKPKGGGGGADTSVQEAMAEADAEIDLFKRAATEKEKLLDEQLKTHAITMTQWLTQTTDALEDEKQDITATYEGELRIAGLTSLQIIQIKRKEADAIADIEQKIRDANYKAAEDSAKKWEDAAKTIESAFDGQIKGLLEGTTSWHKAFMNVLESLTVKIIEWAVNWGVEQSVTVAKNMLGFGGQVAAHVAGNATMAASDQAVGSAGILSWLGSAIKSIEASAAQTFAGVTGFMAPILGPAAPAAGAAAEATVLSVAGGLYDSGAWSVPRDMLAGVHSGEVIIPQRGGLADGFRQMAANGGFGGGRAVNVNPAVHLNISAVDGASVGDFFRQNQRGMMKAIDEAIRHGAHLGTRRLAPA